MTEKTVRPIRVHAGLDVYDLPPDTPARRPGKHAQDQPLELFTGEESVEVEIAGRRRRVAVESDALAADRWWREAERLREQLSRPLAHRGSAPSAVEQTPRERDPLVWAAAYGAAYVGTYKAVYSALDHRDIDERRRAAIATVNESPGAAKDLSEIADAAVMALHGEAPAAEPIERVSYTHEEVEAAFRRYLNERGHRRPTQEDADNSWSLFEGWLPR